MKHVQYIALFLATTVVILHSVVPHNHHCNLSPEEHAKEHASADSLLDFIALGFHGDHGEGQWEDFNSSNEIHAQHSDILQKTEKDDFVLSAQVFPFDSESGSLYFFPGVVRRGLWDSDDLRGPPALM